MKNSLFFSFGLLLALGSCINGEQTFNTDYTHLLSGGNSKVWMLNGGRTNGQKNMNQARWGELLFVFDIEGNFILGSFADFHRGSYSKGRFLYNEKQKSLKIYLKDAYWVFKLAAIQEDGLLLEKVKGSFAADWLQLVPLPIPA